jgi:signal transduction histidine kinase
LPRAVKAWLTNHMSGMPTAGKRYKLWLAGFLRGFSLRNVLPAITVLVLAAAILLWSGNVSIALTLNGSAVALLILLHFRTGRPHPSNTSGTTKVTRDALAQINADAGSITSIDNVSAEKFKFVASIGHDLCQPIHAQSLFLSMLAGTHLTAQQIEIVAHISTAAKSYGTMLNALIEFSRIEAGMVRPKMETFELQPLLNKLEREHAQQAQLKGISYRSRETALAVQSDPVLLESVLHQLLANALRYTDTGGLLIACRKRGATVSIEIWDCGSGIANEIQAELLQGYKQSGRINPDSRKGLGLGLPIACGLANILGHRLTFTSSAQRGSVFRLSLPAATQIH